LISFIILLVAGFIIGSISSLIGIGGGAFMVPLLALFYVHTTQVAVGTSLAVIIFNSLSSTLGYARRRVIDFRLGLTLMVTTIPGAWLGAYLTRFISSGGLSVAFGVLLIGVAFIMLAGQEPKGLALKLRGHTPAEDPIYDWPVVALVGLLAGLSMGFFGIGGGIIMVPALLLLLGCEITTAVATSLFVMGPSALIGSMQHALQADIRWMYFLPLMLGIIGGAQLGVFSSSHIPQQRVRQLFGLVLLYSAANMIWKGLR